MIWYSYTYLTHSQIMELLGNLSSGSIWVIWASIIAVILSLALIYILLPICIIHKQYIAQKKEKLYKKQLLEQILLKKEIEDEVEKEIHIDGEQGVTS